MITFFEDRRTCFVWTKAGRVLEKNGNEQGYLNCSGCRSRNVSFMKFNLTTSEWIDDPTDHNHRCLPKNANTMIDVNAHSIMQAGLASENEETAASARVCTDADSMLESALVGNVCEF
uniref:Transposase n=1 Tax=Ditylenchus dipsaci TaxID=166011 RepID=A0A915CRI6_9BILA